MDALISNSSQKNSLEKFLDLSYKDNQLKQSATVGIFFLAFFLVASLTKWVPIYGPILAISALMTIQASMWFATRYIVLEIRKMKP